MSQRALNSLFKKFVSRTKEKASIESSTILLCELSKSISNSLNISPKVYLTSFSLKHLYDKRTAEEFSFLLQNIIEIVKYPDRVLSNYSGKRGNIALVKNVEGNWYFVPLESQTTTGYLFLVTAFRVRDQRYFKHYKPIWSREGGYQPPS